MAIYPSNVPNDTDYPDRTDDIDYVYDDRYNEIKGEVLAICTELGSLPKGSHADVTARLLQCEFKIAVVDVLPSPAIAHRNTIYCLNGDAGISDKLYICLKSAGGAGQWIIVYDFGTGMYFINNIGDTFMVASISNGEIWISVDGTTWTLEASTIDPRSRCSGGDESLTFAGFDGAAERGKVYVSTDEGDSWALDHTFGVGERAVFRISPVWNLETYFGLYGQPSYGDVYKRDSLGNYTRDLNTGSRVITCLHVSGVNGYLYALTIDGALYEKQNAMAVWTLKHSFSSSYKWRYLADDGTDIIAVGGQTTPVVQTSTDYDTWVNVSIPSEIKNRYAEILAVIKFGDAWYFGTHAGIDGGDVLKLLDGAWSVDLDTGAGSLQSLTVFDSALYAASAGIVDVGQLFKLVSGVESYNWIKIAEG